MGRLFYLMAIHEVPWVDLTETRTRARKVFGAQGIHEVYNSRVK